MSESLSTPLASDSSTARASTAPQDAERNGTRPAPARFAVSQEPLLPNGIAVDEPPMGTYAPSPAYEHLGDLPPTYGSQSVYLVAYDPRQLFAYWDVDPGNAGTASYALRVCRGDGEVESEVAINPREAGRYLVIGVPGGTYYVELGTTGRAGRWRPLGFSGRVTMPPAGLAGEVEPKFATLPFHLSFQRLLELIHDAMGQGENLTAALARLQGGDRQGLDALMGTLATLSKEQLQALERLLGHQVDLGAETGSSFGGGDSSDNSALLAGANGSEALSSAVFGRGTVSSEAFGSESLSSAAGASEVAGVAAFASETFSSQAFGSGEKWASISSAGESFSAVGEFGSETLAVGALGFGSESLSSFGLSESSLGILQGLGINSEAWSLASGGAGLHSEALSSDRAALFFHTLEGNLANLSSMFSSVAAGLSSDVYSSESISSGSGSPF